jgi:ABC-type branched-subunit amino acid transport system substrate-binding protein
VDDLFGLENYAAFKVALQGSGITMVEDKSYPGGVKDLSPVLRSMKDKNPDAFVGFTYPPDTILASRQAKEIGFNPKFFYASVGTAFPLYKNVMTPAGAEGVLGMGSWNSKTSPGAKAYFDAHVASQKKEPDRWASGACWAGLEILTNAVKRRRAWTARPSATTWPTPPTRPSSATSSSTAARTWARRARWASGRTVSSRWCGRRRWRRPSSTQQARLEVI